MNWNKILFVLIFSISSLKARDIIVSPIVNSVIKSETVSDPSGDFFRAILVNSEIDACIYVDRVNLRKAKDPKILETMKYCKFNFNGITLSLAPDKHRDSGVKNANWDKDILKIELSYVGNEISATQILFKCSIDPNKSKKEFTCNLGL